MHGQQSGGIQLSSWSPLNIHHYLQTLHPPALISYRKSFSYSQFSSSYQLRKLRFLSPAMFSSGSRIVPACVSGCQAVLPALGTVRHRAQWPTLPSCAQGSVSLLCLADGLCGQSTNKMYLILASQPSQQMKLAHRLKGECSEYIKCY